MEGFSSATDICQQLLDRYGNSSAPQHRHLCATAAATRSLIQSESLDLTPFSYFAATISTLADETAQLDSNALAAVSSFLTIVLPLLPESAISPDKAKEAVEVLVERINMSGNKASLGNANVRSLVKSLGALLGFCNLADWDSIKLGFEILLKFSIDKRPKVRKCAQDCLLALFKSLKASVVIEEVSRTLHSMLKNQISLAAKESDLKAVDGSRVDLMSKPDLQEIMHMLNLLKSIVPHLSKKVCAKVLSRLLKLLTCEYAALSKHILEIIQVMFETSTVEVIARDIEKVITNLVSYISSKENNPSELVLCAANLLKHAINKLHATDMTERNSLLQSIIGALAGLLSSEAGTALQAANILKELINQHVGAKLVLETDVQLEGDKSICRSRLRAVKSVCGIFDDLLKAEVVPNEYLLGVISVLFLRLGEESGIYMKSIVLKLAEVMQSSSISASDTENLRKCIGAAVVSMGPEKLLALLPISLNPKDFSCSNLWLIPILKDYVVGSSLQFFMEYFVTLADSFQRESMKGEEMETYANNCWELLPAFCRFPTDTYKHFGSLAKLLVSLIKDSPRLEYIAVSLQELVNVNKQVLASDDHSVTELPKSENFPENIWSKHAYSKKIANKNIRALASCSEELLRALIDVFFKLPSDRHENLKDVIGCLASISDPSTIRSIYFSSLKRLQLIKDLGGSEELEFLMDSSDGSKETNATSPEKHAARCLLLKLASCVVDGASEELINLLFKFTCHSLEVTEGTGLPEAYQTLSSILEKHAAFCSAQFVGVMELLLKLKSPTDIASLKSRFNCLRTLLIHALKENLDEENTQAFFILNEIIVALKDSNEEGRKAAYDMLTEVNASLRKNSNSSDDGLHQKLINMVIGYLADSSPHIKSGAVSALSVLIYSDIDLCISVPELIPSVLELLQMKKKSIEVIKVIVILEIMVRKCGVALVKSLVPLKYKDFLQSVLENRHGKTTSKDTSTSENESKPSDSSPRGLKRKKHEDSTFLLKEGGSKVSRERPRDKRPKGSKYGAKEPYNSSGHTDTQKFMKGKENPHRQKSKPHGRDKREGAFKTQSGGKRKVHWAENNKNPKGDSHKPAAQSSKFKRVGKKRSKFQK
ncbi:OLC1v1036792C3 [Oldenlandia corymbosa var. corymbosa]|uniref:OLC1v1036792C3 n=1 Tax=Oldenlandia corymbosa var. corymbosa TaxID=529605 RepID=A0AAV1CY86_OLDCO|nr:OLC1v1036792C3 [Oldenlandia corymbosa var. corymbosa]